MGWNLQKYFNVLQRFVRVSDFETARLSDSGNSSKELNERLKTENGDFTFT